MSNKLGLLATLAIYDEPKIEVIVHFRRTAFALRELCDRRLFLSQEKENFLMHGYGGIVISNFDTEYHARPKLHQTIKYLNLYKERKSPFFSTFNIMPLFGKKWEKVVKCKEVCDCGVKSSVILQTEFVNGVVATVDSMQKNRYLQIETGGKVKSDTLQLHLIVDVLKHGCLMDYELVSFLLNALGAKLKFDIKYVVSKRLTRTPDQHKCGSFSKHIPIIGMFTELVSHHCTDVGLVKMVDTKKIDVFDARSGDLTFSNTFNPDGIVKRKVGSKKIKDTISGAWGMAMGCDTKSRFRGFMTEFTSMEDKIDVGVIDFSVIDVISKNELDNHPFLMSLHHNAERSNAMKVSPYLNDYSEGSGRSNSDDSNEWFSRQTRPHIINIFNSDERVDERMMIRCPWAKISSVDLAIELNHHRGRFVDEILSDGPILPNMPVLLTHVFGRGQKQSQNTIIIVWCDLKTNNTAHFYSHGSHDIVGASHKATKGWLTSNVGAKVKTGIHSCDLIAIKLFNEFTIYNLIAKNNVIGQHAEHLYKLKAYSDRAEPKEHGNKALPVRGWDDCDFYKQNVYQGLKSMGLTSVEEVAASSLHPGFPMEHDNVIHFKKSDGPLLCCDLGSTFGKLEPIEKCTNEEWRMVVLSGGYHDFNTIGPKGGWIKINGSNVLESFDSFTAHGVKFSKSGSFPSYGMVRMCARNVLSNYGIRTGDVKAHDVNVVFVDHLLTLDPNFMVRVNALVTCSGESYVTENLKILAGLVSNIITNFIRRGGIPEADNLGLESYLVAMRQSSYHLDEKSFRSMLPVTMLPVVSKFFERLANFLIDSGDGDIINTMIEFSNSLFLIPSTHFRSRVDQNIGLIDGCPAKEMKIVSDFNEKCTMRQGYNGRMVDVMSIIQICQWRETGYLRTKHIAEMLSISLTRTWDGGYTSWFGTQKSYALKPESTLFLFSSPIIAKLLMNEGLDWVILGSFSPPRVESNEHIDWLSGKEHSTKNRMLKAFNRRWAGANGELLYGTSDDGEPVMKLRSFECDFKMFLRTLCTVSCPPVGYRAITHCGCSICPRCTLNRLFSLTHFTKRSASGFSFNKGGKYDASCVMRCPTCGKDSMSRLLGLLGGNESTDTSGKVKKIGFGKCIDTLNQSSWIKGKEYHSENVVFTKCDYDRLAGIFNGNQEPLGVVRKVLFERAITKSGSLTRDSPSRVGYVFDEHLGEFRQPLNIQRLNSETNWDDQAEIFVLRGHFRSHQRFYHSITLCDTLECRPRKGVDNVNFHYWTTCTINIRRKNRTTVDSYSYSAFKGCAFNNGVSIKVWDYTSKTDEKLWCHKRWTDTLMNHSHFGMLKERNGHFADLKPFASLIRSFLGHVEDDFIELKYDYRHVNEKYFGFYRDYAPLNGNIILVDGDNGFSVDLFARRLHLTMKSNGYKDFQLFNSALIHMEIASPMLDKITNCTLKGVTDIDEIMGHEKATNGVKDTKVKKFLRKVFLPDRFYAAGIDDRYHSAFCGRPALCKNASEAFNIHKDLKYVAEDGLNNSQSCFCKGYVHAFVDRMRMCIRRGKVPILFGPNPWLLVSCLLDSSHLSVRNIGSYSPQSQVGVIPFRVRKRTRGKYARLIARGVQCSGIEHHVAFRNVSALASDNFCGADYECHTEQYHKRICSPQNSLETNLKRTAWWLGLLCESIKRDFKKYKSESAIRSEIAGLLRKFAPTDKEYKAYPEIVSHLSKSELQSRVTLFFHAIMDLEVDHPFLHIGEHRFVEILYDCCNISRSPGLYLHALGTKQRIHGVQRSDIIELAFRSFRCKKGPFSWTQPSINVQCDQECCREFSILTGCGLASRKGDSGINIVCQKEGEITTNSEGTIARSGWMPPLEYVYPQTYTSKAIDYTMSIAVKHATKKIVKLLNGYSLNDPDEIQPQFHQNIDANLQLSVAPSALGVTFSSKGSDFINRLNIPTITPKDISKNKVYRQLSARIQNLMPLKEIQSLCYSDVTTIHVNGGTTSLMSSEHKEGGVEFKDGEKYDPTIHDKKDITDEQFTEISEMRLSHGFQHGGRGTNFEVLRYLYALRRVYLYHYMVNTGRTLVRIQTDEIDFLGSDFESAGKKMNAHMDVFDPYHWQVKGVEEDGSQDHKVFLDDLMEGRNTDFTPYFDASGSWLQIDPLIDSDLAQHPCAPHDAGTLQHLLARDVNSSITHCIKMDLGIIPMYTRMHPTVHAENIFYEVRGDEFCNTLGGKSEDILNFEDVLEEAKSNPKLKELWAMTKKSSEVKEKVCYTTAYLVPYTFKDNSYRKDNVMFWVGGRKNGGLYLVGGKVIGDEDHYMTLLREGMEETLPIRKSRATASFIQLDGDEFIFDHKIVYVHEDDEKVNVVHWYFSKWLGAPWDANLYEVPLKGEFETQFSWQTLKAIQNSNKTHQPLLSKSLRRVDETLAFRATAERNFKPALPVKEAIQKVPEKKHSYVHANSCKPRSGKGNKHALLGLACSIPWVSNGRELLIAQRDAIFVHDGTNAKRMRGKAPSITVIDMSDAVDTSTAGKYGINYAKGKGMLVVNKDRIHDLIKSNILIDIDPAAVQSGRIWNKFVIFDGERSRLSLLPYAIAKRLGIVSDEEQYDNQKEWQIKNSNFNNNEDVRCLSLFYFRSMLSCLTVDEAEMNEDVLGHVLQGANWANKLSPRLFSRSRYGMLWWTDESKKMIMHKWKHSIPLSLGYGKLVSVVPLHGYILCSAINVLSSRLIAEAQSQIYMVDYQDSVMCSFHSTNSIKIDETIKVILCGPGTDVAHVAQDANILNFTGYRRQWEDGDTIRTRIVDTMLRYAMSRKGTSFYNNVLLIRSVDHLPKVNYNLIGVFINSQYVDKDSDVDYNSVLTKYANSVNMPVVKVQSGAHLSRRISRLIVSHKQSARFAYVVDPYLWKQLIKTNVVKAQITKCACKEEMTYWTCAKAVQFPVSLREPRDDDIIVVIGNYVSANTGLMIYRDVVHAAIVNVSQKTRKRPVGELVSKLMLAVKDIDVSGHLIAARELPVTHFCLYTLSVLMNLVGLYQSGGLYEWGDGHTSNVWHNLEDYKASILQAQSFDNVKGTPRTGRASDLLDVVSSIFNKQLVEDEIQKNWFLDAFDFHDVDGWNSYDVTTLFVQWLINSWITED